METGAVVAVTVQAAGAGDTKTLPQALDKALEQVQAAHDGRIEGHDGLPAQLEEPAAKGDLQRILSPQPLLDHGDIPAACRLMSR